MPDGKSETATPRITNGPQILCWCGAISNHITGLCTLHREDMLTDGDRAYLQWKQQRDGRGDVRLSSRAKVPGQRDDA